MKKNNMEIKKIEEHILSAFENNRDNFIDEINRLIIKDDYPINVNTEVLVKGCFHKEKCYPFLQFRIDMGVDTHIVDTEFYRSDYNLDGKKIKIDEFEIDYKIVDVLTLYYNDLR
jgi:hypothetical protein